MRLFRDWKTFWRRQEGDVKPEDEKIGSVSMNDGEHGTIFGINRKIVLGIGIAFFTTFAIAFIFASNTPAQDKPAVAQRPQEAAAARASGSRATSDLPGDYESLIKANANFAGQGTRPQQRQGSGTGTPRTANEPAANSGASIAVPPPAPSIPRAIAAQNPYLNPAVRTPAEPAVNREAQELAQRMRSAIAFNIGQAGNTSARQTVAGESASIPDSVGTSETTAMVQPSASASGIVSVTYAAPNSSVLQAGTIIPVALCTGINSDTGGQVIAQVQQNVYDSYTGERLLIPAGAKLLGAYSKGSANNSGRVEVTFSTLIMPDGGSYAIGNSMVAVDGAGYNGISGKINRHTGQVLSAGVFSSGLAALGSIAAGNTGNSDTYTAGQLAAQGAMSNLMNAASSLFQQGANRQMTVSVEPGYQFNVYVTQGITLK